MKTEEEIKFEILKFEDSMKKRENTELWYCDYGYINALKWVLEEE